MWQLMSMLWDTVLTPTELTKSLRTVTGNTSSLSPSSGEARPTASARWHQGLQPTGYDVVLGMHVTSSISENSSQGTDSGHRGASLAADEQESGSCWVKPHHTIPCITRLCSKTEPSSLHCLFSVALRTLFTNLLQFIFSLLV